MESDTDSVEKSESERARERKRACTQASGHESERAMKRASKHFSVTGKISLCY